MPRPAAIEASRNAAGTHRARGQIRSAGSHRTELCDRRRAPRQPHRGEKVDCERRGSTHANVSEKPHLRHRECDQ